MSLQFSLLHSNYIIITYYYIFVITLLLHHYKALLLDHYYLLLRYHWYELLHHHYTIITSLLRLDYGIMVETGNNELIITYYAFLRFSLLHCYYPLSPLLPIITYYHLRNLQIPRFSLWPAEVTVLFD